MEKGKTRPKQTYILSIKRMQVGLCTLVLLSAFNRTTRAPAIEDSRPRLCGANVERLRLRALVDTDALKTKNLGYGTWYLYSGELDSKGFDLVSFA